MRIQQPCDAKRTYCRFVTPAQYQTMRGAAAAFSGAIGSARIRRAQEAIEALSTEFPNWMRDDVTELDEAWRRIRDAGGKEPAFESLLLAALSIKGTGAMLGYPYSGRICASLIELLQESPDASRIPLELIGHHVDAVKAELRKKVDVSTCDTANALVAGLHRVSLAFIRNEKARIACQQDVVDQTTYRCDPTDQTRQPQALQ